MKVCAMAPSKRQQLEDGLVEYMTKVGEWETGISSKTHKEWAFCSPAQFYLKKGKLFSAEEFQVPEQVVLNRLPALRYKTGECFKNAMDIVLSTDTGLTYCEGYAVRDLFPMHHAWVCVNGKPVDVTWTMKPHMKDGPTRNIDKILSRVDFNRAFGAYYGIEVPLEVVRRHILDGEIYSPVVEGVKGKEFVMLKTGRVE